MQTGKRRKTDKCENREDKQIEDENKCKQEREERQTNEKIEKQNENENSSFLPFCSNNNKNKLQRIKGDYSLCQKSLCQKSLCQKYLCCFCVIPVALIMNPHGRGGGGRSVRG
jgi:hypothetical protein